MTWLKIKFAIGIAAAVLLVGGVATVALSDSPIATKAPANAASSGSITNSPRQILLATILLKAPTDKIDSLVAELDLANLKTPLNPKSASFQKFLEQHPELDYLGAPQIITSSGQEAVITITNPTQADNTPADTEITVDATPSLQSGSVVNLTLDVELREAAGGQPPTVVTTKLVPEFPPFKLGKTLVSAVKLGGDGRALGAAADGSQSLVVLIYATTVQQRLQKILVHGN